MTQQEHIEAALDHLTQIDQCPPDGQTIAANGCLSVTCADCWRRFIFGSNGIIWVVVKDSDQ